MTAVPAFRFDRRYSYFAPSHTYAVHDQDGRWIGEVARQDSAPTPAARRRWHASNKTWTSGADLPGTFSTRQQAAQALSALSSTPTTTR